MAERHSSYLGGTNPRGRTQGAGAHLGFARNGMDAAARYAWRPGEAEREAELAATLAAIRAEAARRAEVPDPDQEAQCEA